MIYEHSRATGAYEAAQTLTGLFTKSVQNDDVQNFDLSWDQALLSASDMPSDILERLYKSKSQNSVLLQTLLALCDQETARNNGKPNYSQLKTVVKLHIGEMMKTRNFRVRNDVVERDQSPRIKKDGKPALKRKCESVSSGKHMVNVPKETHVVAVMAVARARDEKDDRLLPHPSRRRNRLTARDKNPPRNQAIKRKALWIKRAKFHANSVKTCHVSSSILRESELQI